MSFSEEKRKKLIVPAIALMMCAVAMVGIGFAMQSTVTSNNNITVNDFIANVGDYGDLEGNYIGSDVNNKFSFTVEKTNVKVGTDNTYKYKIVEGEGQSYIKVKGTGNYTLNVKTSISGLTISFYETSSGGATNGDAIASIQESIESGSTAKNGNDDFKFSTNSIYKICIEDIKDGLDITNTALTITFEANSV